MSNAPKQLKKNDFLAHVTEAPMSRQELVDALIDYDFIASYLDFLVDHFEAQGKLVKNEDGTFNRKGRKVAAAREAFRVVTDVEDNYVVEKMAITVLLTEDQKAEGWATTQGAAIKKACQTVFADYKANTASIRLLVDAEAVEALDEA